MYEISNEFLTVTATEGGAELTSVKTADGREWLWQGDPAWWAPQAPIVFPICGSLKDDVYLHEGKYYSLPKHGFGRHSLFTLEKAEKESMTFLLTDNKETRERYPFAFAFRVTFTLKERSIVVTYEMKNTGDKPLYYSVGAHEGYACPEGIEEYSVILPQPETLDRTLTEDGLLSFKTEPIMESTDELPLKKEYFKKDAIILKEIKSRSVRLRHRPSGRTVKVDFDDFDLLLLWTKPGAPYLCIEPWCGLPDTKEVSGVLAEKPLIRPLAAGESESIVHTITIE